MMRAVLFIRALSDVCWFHIVRTPRVHAAIVTGALIALFLAFLFLIPPGGFPNDRVIVINEGESFGELASSLERENIVRSAFALRVLARLTGTDDTVNTGRYLFQNPIGSAAVLSRLATGEHGIPTVRVTFPEGTSVREMGKILEGAIAGFNEASWEATAKGKEGYLFPDTYDFFKDATIEEILNRMRDNFDARTKDIQLEISEKGLHLDRIIIMASLIEKEANTEEDRHLVSGILWSRIEEGVALQVDAVFPYIRKNPDHVPNGDDPELESPYNTYLNRDLPPGPITNPGLDAIDAALHPTATDYFYYLTGVDGKMYYAESFEEHKTNQQHLN